jgi:DNA-binding NarL/FixJ family response regulator
VEASNHHQAREAVARTLLVSGDRSIAEEAGLVGPESRPADGAELLTARELEVLDLLAEGLSNSAIAAKLFISLSTAKVHVHHVLKKLGVETRLQAALKARERSRGDA